MHQAEARVLNTRLHTIAIQVERRGPAPPTPLSTAADTFSNISLDSGPRNGAANVQPNRSQKIDSRVRVSLSDS